MSVGLLEFSKLRACSETRHGACKLGLQVALNLLGVFVTPWDGHLSSQEVLRKLRPEVRDQVSTVTEGLADSIHSCTAKDADRCCCCAGSTVWLGSRVLRKYALPASMTFCRRYLLLPLPPYICTWNQGFSLKQKALRQSFCR